MSEEILSDSHLQQPHDMPPVADLRVGDVVEGIVTELTDDSIFLDVSCKTDACMSRSELESGETIKPNDTIRVKVININAERELILVSRNRITEEKSFDKLTSCYEKQEAIVGVVSAVQSHGFSVTLFDGLEAFMPFSHASLNKLINPDSYMQKELPVLITKLEQLRNSYDIVVSHRELLTYQLQGARAEFLKKYTEGDVVDGVVEDIFPNYARIRVDGIPATIVQSEVSWLNNVILQRELSIGQNVQVKITALAEEGRKVFVSIKALSEDPWLTIDEALTIDSVVEGEVETAKEFGLFVRVADAYQGLVHISEVSWENEKQAVESYQEGQRIQVKILAIEASQRRLTLSIRQVIPSPWEKYYQEHTDEVITATIMQTHKFGLVCRLSDNIEGFLHQSHITWGNRSYNPAEFTVGEQIQAAIIGANDRHRKVRLSLKTHQDNPWDTLLQLKQEHAVVEVTISQKTNDGLIVSVGDGVEGFIHVNHIANFERLAPAELLAGFQEGGLIEANISMVDKRKRKIYLSTKYVEMGRASAEMEKYMVSGDEPTANIADLTDRS